MINSCITNVQTILLVDSKGLNRNRFARQLARCDSFPHFELNKLTLNISTLILITIIHSIIIPNVVSSVSRNSCCAAFNEATVIFSQIIALPGCKREVHQITTQLSIWTLIHNRNLKLYYRPQTDSVVTCWALFKPHNIHSPGYTGRGCLHAGKITLMSYK